MAMPPVICRRLLASVSGRLQNGLMIKVFEDFDLARVGQMQSVLAAAGIQTLLKNRFMSSVMGEIPFTEVLPELWVVDSREAARARELLEAVLAEPPADLPDWTCAGCATEVEGVFDRCWNCGATQAELGGH